MQAQILLKKIEQEFPELKWKDYELVTKGWDFDVVILDKKIVFRFPKEEDSITNLKKEIVLLNYLDSRFSADIPQYCYIANDQSFAGYLYLNGRELTVSRYKKFDSNVRKLLQKMIADFISSLHQTPTTILKKYKTRIGKPEKFLEWLVHDTEKYVFPKLNKNEIKYINEHFDELRKALNDKYSPVLVHGDLTEGHILWDDKKDKLSMIDFSDHHIGDPATDFSGLIEFGEEFITNVYNLYLGPKDENLLHRARLNYKTLPLTVMKGALCEAPVSFEGAYAMFKERFNIK